MRNRVLRLFSLAAVFLLAGSELFACGDKFLTVGRGGRFQRGYISVHPASIALLNTKTAGQRDFQTRLKLAGHRVRTANDVDKLETILRSGTYDVVLADYTEAAAVSGIVAKTSSNPLFLPVVDAASRDFDEAMKKYGCPLDPATGKRAHFLAVLDQALDEKVKGKPVDCDTVK